MWGIEKAIISNERVVDALSVAQFELLKHEVSKLDLEVNDKLLKPIGDFWKLQGGYAFNSNDFVKQGVQLIRIGNCYERRLDLERNPVFLPEAFLIKFPNFVLQPGDIVLSMTGTFGKKDYAFAIQMPIDIPPLLLNQRVGRFQPISDKSELLTEYFMILLHSDYFLGQIYSFGQGSKQANLSSNQIESVLLPIPKKEIQELIVNIWTKFNIVKVRHLEHGDKLSRLKGAMMNKLIERYKC